MDTPQFLHTQPLVRQCAGLPPIQWTSLGRQITRAEYTALELQRERGTLIAAAYLHRIGYPFVNARYLLLLMRKG